MHSTLPLHSVPDKATAHVPPATALITAPHHHTDSEGNAHEITSEHPVHAVVFCTMAVLLPSAHSFKGGDSHCPRQGKGVQTEMIGY